MSLAWNRFYHTVLVLTEAGSPRERLMRAYHTHLADLRPKDLPAEIRGDFLKLTLAMAGCSGVVAPISDSDVESMIRLVITMYDTTTRYQPLLKTAEYGNQHTMPVPVAHISKAAVRS